MDKPLNVYLVPVYLAANRYGICHRVVASLSQCVVCDVVSDLPEDRSMSSELAPWGKAGWVTSRQLW